MRPLETDRHEGLYESFLSTRSARQWRRIGLKRRSGVAVPLFSLYSRASLGIGDLHDLMLLADWSKTVGMSIIQLLPMNDVGFEFRPYDAKSTFALEPMYLALSDLAGVRMDGWSQELERLRQNFPVGRPSVDYTIKTAKLELLGKIFQSTEGKWPSAFNEFCRQNRFWLRDYARFKVLKEINDERGWEDWAPELKERVPGVLKSFEDGHAERILFHEWLQWQLFTQFAAVKRRAGQAGVLLMGDLPFLVSRDSADVWSHQDYFLLDRSSGAPPDMYFAKGQRWGMPPYCWDRVEAHGYDYLVEKLRYAEHFYDLFRIDHVVGVFRLWTIPLPEPLENGGLNGVFLPEDQDLWEAHGRKLLSVLTESTGMLACAEDLGVVPECSDRVLGEFGIPGMDVTRWKKNWGRTYEFASPDTYRPNSIAVLSSHDTSILAGWWEVEAGTVDEELFRRMCGARGLAYDRIRGRLFEGRQSRHGRLRWRREAKGVDLLLDLLGLAEGQAREFVDLYSASYHEKEKFWKFLRMEGQMEEKSLPGFVKRALQCTNASASIFSVQLLQDWLSLDSSWLRDPWDFRINFPGTTSGRNWSLAMPFSLEKLKDWPMNDDLRALNRQTGRCS